MFNKKRKSKNNNDLLVLELELKTSDKVLSEMSKRIEYLESENKFLSDKLEIIKILVESVGRE